MRLYSFIGSHNFLLIIVGKLVIDCLLEDDLSFVFSRVGNVILNSHFRNKIRDKTAIWFKREQDQKKVNLTVYFNFIRNRNSIYFNIITMSLYISETKLAESGFALGLSIFLLKVQLNFQKIRHAAYGIFRINCLFYLCMVTNAILPKLPKYYNRPTDVHI